MKSKFLFCVLISASFCSIPECLNNILKNYFKSDTLIYLINLNFNLEFPVVYQSSLKPKLRLFEYRKPDFYILSQENLFQVLDYLDNFEIFNPRAKFLILTDNVQNYRKTFAKLSSYYIFDAILINSETELITSDLVFHNCSENNFQNNLEITENTSTVQSVFFQDYPYIYEEQNRFQGIYYEFFKTVSKSLKTNLQLVENLKNGTNNRSSTLGKISSNLFITNNKFSDCLLTRQFPFMLNFNTARRTDFFKFDLIPLHLTFYFYWVVPKSQKLPPWKTLYQNFDSLVWIAILSTLTVLAIFRKFLLKQSLVFSFLVHFQLLVENSNFKFQKIKNSKIRFVIFVSLFSFFVLSTSFKTSMIRSFTRNLYEHQVNSLREIIKSKLKCYTTEEIKEVYSSDESVRSYIEECSTFSTKKRDEILAEFAQNAKTAITVRRIEYKYTVYKFFLMGYQESLVHLIPRRIKLDYAYIYFTKGHPLYLRFYKVIRRINNSGISNWLVTSANFRIDKVLKSKSFIHSQTLDFYEISVAFWVLVIGLSFSALVFLAELYHIRFNK